QRVLLETTAPPAADRLFAATYFPGGWPPPPPPAYYHHATAEHQQAAAAAAAYHLNKTMPPLATRSDLMYAMRASTPPIGVSSPRLAEVGVANYEPPPPPPSQADVANNDKAPWHTMLNTETVALADWSRH